MSPVIFITKFNLMRLPHCARNDNQKSNVKLLTECPYPFLDKKNPPCPRGTRGIRLKKPLIIFEVC